jgi:hypothetical protein
MKHRLPKLRTTPTSSSSYTQNTVTLETRSIDISQTCPFRCCPQTGIQIATSDWLSHSTSLTKMNQAGDEGRGVDGVEACKARAASCARFAQSTGQPTSKAYPGMASSKRNGSADTVGNSVKVVPGSRSKIWSLTICICSQSEENVSRRGIRKTGGRQLWSLQQDRLS